MILVDDAFPEIDRIREHALRAEYGTMIGPDDASYPNMSFDIPEWLGTMLGARLRELVGPFDPYTIFFRLSTAGTPIPHWAHTDTKLCDAMALLYLSKEPPDGSGTVIVRHLEGLDRFPTCEAEFDLWRRDHSDYSKWVITDVAPMRYNRLALIPSYLLHAAMPPDGFGSTVEDGRLVLITFFNLLGDQP